MTVSIECAKLVRPVRKEEWINTFLIEITLNPKITNEQLAEKFSCHRNTVSKYRKIIRQRQLRTNQEIVNKIDNVLEDRLPDMETHNLIAYRRSVAPEEHHVTGEYTETHIDISAQVKELINISREIGECKQQKSQPSATT